MALTFEEWEKEYNNNRPIEPNTTWENPVQWAEIAGYAEDKLKEAFDAGYQSCREKYSWQFLKDGNFPPQEYKLYLFYLVSRHKECVTCDTWNNKRYNSYVIAWAEFEYPESF